MRVKIGPFQGDIIPVRRWERSYERMRSSDGAMYLDEEEYTWYDKIVMGIFDKIGQFVLPLNRWSNDRQRKVNIHIDDYDIWSADNTIALIMVPLLKKLKTEYLGYPSQIDCIDIPADMQITPEEVGSEEVFNKKQAQWDYILGEMIWAFEQHVNDDNDEQFYHNIDQLELIPTPVDDIKGYTQIEINEQKDPNKPPYRCDREGLEQHHRRIKNGLYLFAKYYNNLWI